MNVNFHCGSAVCKYCPVDIFFEPKKAWLETALKDNIKIPEPSKGVDDYSGKINLRMPKSLHRILAKKVKEEKVSLNQFFYRKIFYEIIVK